MPRRAHEEGTDLNVQEGAHRAPLARGALTLFSRSTRRNVARAIAAQKQFHFSHQMSAEPAAGKKAVARARTAFENARAAGVKALLWQAHAGAEASRVTLEVCSDPKREEKKEVTYESLFAGLEKDP